MQTFKVTATNGLKIRELPSSASKVLDVMPHGMRVTLLDESPWYGTWHRIRADFSDNYRVEGYAFGGYLEPTGSLVAGGMSSETGAMPVPEPEPAPNDDAASDYLYLVASSSLRLREKPTTTSKILMNMKYGTMVAKLGDASNLGWWKVSAKSGSMTEEGYVMAKFLAPRAPKPARGVDLSLLSDITNAVKRVKEFVHDYADELDEPLLRTLNEVVTKYQINATPLRFCHFMAQIAHESTNFTRIEENLNYGAAGLMSTFGKYFENEQEAAQYERQPERIANRVYANRMGNGDEASGDGYRYRGRGYIQLTGRENYQDIGERLKLPLESDPDLITQDRKTALAVSAAFWDKKNLNEFADRDDLDNITYLINGGDNGLGDRAWLLMRAKMIWGS